MASLHLIMEADPTGKGVFDADSSSSICAVCQLCWRMQLQADCTGGSFFCRHIIEPSVYTLRSFANF